MKLLGFAEPENYRHQVGIGYFLRRNPQQARQAAASAAAQAAKPAPIPTAAQNEQAAEPAKEQPTESDAAAEPKHQRKGRGRSKTEEILALLGGNRKARRCRN